MLSRCSPRAALLAAALILIGMPAAVHGQAAITDAPWRRPAVSMSGGAFSYDLSGTGTVPMVAVRAELPLTRFALVEGGLTAARPDQQFGARSTFLAPEAQLQFQLPVAGGRVAPYLGAGAGAAVDVRRRQFGGTQADLTVSGAGGLRAWLSAQLGLRAELRVRGIGRGFTGGAAEWTLGAAWRP